MTIAKKHAQKAVQEFYHGLELSLEQVIQAAIDEATAGHEAFKRAFAMVSADQLERIRQLEQERVPEGWRIVERNTGSIIVYKEKIGSCVVSECPETERTIPEAILWALAKDILAAAPAQEKV